MNPKADGRALADEFHLVSTRDREAILKFVSAYPSKIDGVMMTIASDIPHMVAAAGEALGVRHIPVAVAELCVHKLHMKERLREARGNVSAFCAHRLAGRSEGIRRRVRPPHCHQAGG